MSPQTSFADRIAKIEARASGKLPLAPVIAPMVGEDLREIEKKRGRASRMKRVFTLPLLGAALGAGLYSGELIAMLPPQVAAEILTRPDTLGELMRAQVTPEQFAQLTGAAMFGPIPEGAVLNE